MNWIDLNYHLQGLSLLAHSILKHEHIDNTPEDFEWSEFLATDPEVLGSIPVASRFFEKQWIWNGVHSASWEQLRSYLKEK
jgi:hypothetical protein